MPNWCYTQYRILGDSEKREELFNAIESLSKMEKPLVDSDFGNLWLGCLVTYFGGDWRTIACRGSITTYANKSEYLDICTETAWAECREVRKFLQEKFPKLEFYYISEESGMCEYYTNDSTYEIFHTKYFLDTCDLEFDSEEFANEKELVAFLNSKGIKCHDEESAMKAVKEYADDIEDEDKYISLYKYQIED